MKKNMNGTDRMIRLGVAALAAVLYFTGVLSGTAGLIALAVGGILLVTSFVSFCPLYALFGLSTSSAQK